jgi:hypothetical protein
MLSLSVGLSIPFIFREVSIKGCNVKKRIIGRGPILVISLYTRISSFKVAYSKDDIPQNGLDRVY